MIKKVFFCIIFIFFSDLCYAQCISFDNIVYSNRVCEKNTFISSTYRYMKEKSLESFLKKYIKQKIGIDADISLTLDSRSSESTYIFNNAKIYSNKVQIACLQLTDVLLSSVNSENTIIKQNGGIYFPQDIPINFSTKITNENLLFLTSSIEYKNFIYQITEKYSQYIQIQDTSLYIDNNNIKLKVIGKLPFLFGMPVKITVTPILEVSDGHIYIREISVDKNSVNYINKILPILNFSEPIDSYLKISEISTAAYKFDNLTIENNEIYVFGVFIIPQNCDIN